MSFRLIPKTGALVHRRATSGLSAAELLEHVPGVCDGLVGDLPLGLLAGLLGPGPAVGESGSLARLLAALLALMDLP